MFLTPVVNIFQNIVNQKKPATALQVETDSWEAIEEAYENQTLITGYLDYQVDKGYIIRFGDIIAFSPRYQFDLCEYNEVPVAYYNTPLEFTVLSCDQNNEQLIVSRVEALQIRHSEYLYSLNKGDVLKGQVTAVMDKLVTLDINGLTCLVSRSEISWQPFNHPQEIVSVGDVVDVKLLRVVPRKAYLTGTVKQLDISCWQQFIQKHRVGSEVEVAISHIADFGYFVTYNGKLSGILHWSELSWQPQSKQQAMSYSRGDVLRVKVSQLDLDKQQVSFSLKAMQQNPVKQLIDNYKVGDLVCGEIRSRTDFGLFVEIADNFNGLLHFSNLSWFTNSKNNLVNFRVGSKLQCKIIDVDQTNKRVGLGLKQLTDNPFIHQPSLHSLQKSPDFPRPVSIAVSSYFQANCHNQIVAMLNDMQRKVRQHVDLSVENLFFEETPSNLPDILIVLLSDDYFDSTVHAQLRALIQEGEGVKPLVIPVVADDITEGTESFLLDMACLPADRKALQHWRVKSAYWSSINKSLIKSIRYVAGLK